MGQEGGEFASLVETRSQDTGDLLDERVGGEEGIVPLGCSRKIGRC